MAERAFVHASRIFTKAKYLASSIPSSFRRNSKSVQNLAAFIDSESSFPCMKSVFYTKIKNEALS